MYVVFFSFCFFNQNITFSFIENYSPIFSQSFHSADANVPSGIQAPPVGKHCSLLEQHTSQLQYKAKIKANISTLWEKLLVLCLAQNQIRRSFSVSFLCVHFRDSSDTGPLDTGCSNWTYKRFFSFDSRFEDKTIYGTEKTFWVFQIHLHDATPSGRHLIRPKTHSAAGRVNAQNQSRKGLRQKRSPEADEIHRRTEAGSPRCSEQTT